MPIYEFYCKQCNTLYNFFSSKTDTATRPSCPRCRRVKLERRISLFSTPRNRGGEDEALVPDMDEDKLEKAMNTLAGEFEHADENDPRQAADMMRRLTDMTGLELGPGMQEALRRMEAGEDPEQIEADMGDLLEGEEPLAFRKAGGKPSRSLPPRVDDTLYEL